ncbi:motility associated factor glycosyltransferase family protein [Campylobacter molothri]|uniref:motility associated factor glycosyltransferase family protein n=1 Tax=Campylobacter molothri TaxID=1032242 RepID=UPI001EFBBA14|nr:motility associated factor glycosyltransferase family protein [Campylobacter sp. RM10537]MBZ7950255.1 motility associated factor glycosyltransferase family protein [Campylobacter sp. RM10534]ULO00138.1 motility accessory factor [Campylobacter sp. RM10537]
MNILEKNIQALASGTNEPLALKLNNFLENQKCTRFSLDKNLNIFDLKNQVFMYNDVNQEIDYFKNAILEKTLRYPFVCIYGIGNALLLKSLISFYKHIFIFESEIELFILALSVIDLSEELSNGKIYLVDINEEKVNMQLSILFGQRDMFEYLSLYEIFMNSYYQKYFIDEISQINDKIYETINFIIRNLDPSSKIPLICYDNFIQNIPLILKSIPFQRIIQERKNQFENCIVVCAGPSLEKQIPLLKKYQENFVIFCADGAFPLLYKNDIIPDYILNLDLEEYPIEFFKDIDINKLEKTLFILAQSTHPSVVNFLKNINFAIVLNGDITYEKLNLFDFGYLEVGTHVGHMCYTLALALGFKNIIIIGQDLAYNDKGNSHFSDFILGKDADLALNIPSLKTLAYGGVKEVFTHIGWDDYRKKLEFLFANNTQANFYNATEGGARIAFTKELSFKECCLKFANQKKKILEIPKKLTSNRSDKFLKKVIENLKQDLHIVNQTLEDAKILYNALEKILLNENKLPLNFLSNIYKNIENFNFVLEKNEIFKEGIFRGIFFKRGFELSQIITLKIQEEEKYLLLMIKVYKNWLILLIEKLITIKGSLEKII